MLDYGVMPWHFGGEERLTYGEVEAIIQHFNKRKEAEAKQARDQARGRGQGPRPRARRRR